MSIEDIDLACESIFQSPAKSLTIEFQGGDPLLRFDLIKRAIETSEEINRSMAKSLRFVVASTLHQLTTEMCEFFAAHKVMLSTSIDGPEDLHNRNRPISTRDSYQRTLVGIEVARKYLGNDGVSALMTTTKLSLQRPEAIVDEYVKLGFRDIFLRPLSLYGFAKRNQIYLGYTLEQFADFYWRGLERVLYWNRQGIELREVYSSILLNKMLSTFDAGYVDLQSPTGAGTAVIVYNYDGYVYPSDEARMLAETGDRSLRLGRIGESLEALRQSQTQRCLTEASQTKKSVACQKCPYQLFCSPNPVDAQAQFGDMFVPAEQTEHCKRHLWLFDSLYLKLSQADPWLSSLFYSWAQPTAGGQ